MLRKLIWFGAGAGAAAETYVWEQPWQMAMTGSSSSVAL